MTGPLCSGKRTFAQKLGGRQVYDVQDLADAAADLNRDVYKRQIHTLCRCQLSAQCPAERVRVAIRHGQCRCDGRRHARGPVSYTHLVRTQKENEQLLKIMREVLA